MNFQLRKILLIKVSYFFIFSFFSFYFLFIFFNFFFLFLFFVFILSFSVGEEIRISLYAFPMMALFTIPFNYLEYLRHDLHYDSIEVFFSFSFSFSFLFYCFSFKSSLPLFLSFSKQKNRIMDGHTFCLVHFCFLFLRILPFIGFIVLFIILFYIRFYYYYYYLFCFVLFFYFICFILLINLLFSFLYFHK